MQTRHLRPQLLHATIGLVRADGTISPSIAWRVYGFGAGAVWLQSIPNGTRCKLSAAELDQLLESRHLAIVNQTADN